MVLVRVRVGTGADIIGGAVWDGAARRAGMAGRGVRSGVGSGVRSGLNGAKSAMSVAIEALSARSDERRVYLELSMDGWPHGRPLLSGVAKAVPLIQLDEPYQPS